MVIRELAIWGWSSGKRAGPARQFSKLSERTHRCEESQGERVRQCRTNERGAKNRTLTFKRERFLYQVGSILT